MDCKVDCPFGAFTEKKSGENSVKGTEILVK